MVHPDHVKNLEFRPVIAEATQVIPEMRRQADVVIAATHMGHYENGVHGTQAEGDVEMARATRGIDLIVGGHTQNPACMKAENVLDRAYVPGTECQPDRQHGTWIVQAHEWGKYVGRADFNYRNGAFSLVKYALIPINLKKSVVQADGKTTLQTYVPEIVENKDMLALLSPYQSMGQARLGLEIGSTDGRLEGDRAVARVKPIAMGVLVGRALMEKTNADFAVTNAGGIRDGIASGKITYKDVLKVHPFGNTIATVDLSGAEVLAYLNAIVKMSPGSGAFPQFAGIQLLVESGKVSSASLHGAPLQAQKTYRMAVNNFQAVGGDGYPKLTDHPSYQNTGFVDADVLKAFITAHSPIKSMDFEPGNAVVRR
jgi:5'-nucleotidase/UDP-sugar diphosphatase